MRTLSLGIPPQGTSIRQGWLESTPYNALGSRPPPDPPPPPLGWGLWVGLALPNPVLPLPMGNEQPVHKVDSELKEMYPLLESIPI